MSYYSDDELRRLGFAHIGKNVRLSRDARFYGVEHMEIGDNSRIDDFCVISGRVVIGRNVRLAPFCLVAGGEKGVFIDDFAGLAYGVQVFSQSDAYSGRTLTNPTIPALSRHNRKQAVHLGRHVIVGANSVVFPGVELAEGCSVGAMTLVNKSTTPWGIYAGNPARRVREREQGLLQLEREYVSKETDDTV